MKIKFLKSLVAAFLIICLTVSSTVWSQDSAEPQINNKANNTASNKALRVLVFAPHPDDDLIGTGGSIAKHISKGNKVSIVYMTSGDSGNIGFDKAKLASIREEEAINGAKILGVSDVTFLRNPDGYLEVNQGNLVALTKIIRNKKPDVVYVTSKEEGHRDHRATNELVTNAVGRAGGPWFPEAGTGQWEVSYLLEYEVHPPLSSTNYCEDISKFIDLKVQSLKEHKSQIEDIHYEDSAKALNEYRGILTSGKSKYAECFRVIKIKSLF